MRKAHLRPFCWIQNRFELLLLCVPRYILDQEKLYPKYMCVVQNLEKYTANSHLW